MKTATYGAIVMLALLLGVSTSKALPTVTTISDVPTYTHPNFAGYVDNCATENAQFNTPSGIAYDTTQNYLYVADRNNNAIRVLDLLGDQTSTFITYLSNVQTSLISTPVGVAVDGTGNVFVLNYGSGKNGTVMEFDTYGDLVATNAAQLTNAAGIALDNSDNIYVTVNSNSLIQITPSGVKTNIATIAIAGTWLQGIVVKRAGANAGLIAACDAGRDGIYLINPANGVVTTNTGFNGQGDSVKTNNNAGTIKSQTKFFQPSGIAEAGDGSLIVSDYGNNEVKVVSTSGTTTNLYGVPSYLWDTQTSDPTVFPGWWDGTYVVPFQVGYAESRLPFGLAIAPDGSVYVSEDYYHVIRHVTGTGFQPPLFQPIAPAKPLTTVAFGQINLTWSAVSGATSYNVKRSLTSGGPYTTIVNQTGTSYSDTTGLINGTTYYYVISAVGAGGEGANSPEAGVTLPILLPPTGLAATTNFTSVNLTWSASLGAASYNVKRSTSTNGPFTTIASPTITSYSDTSVVNGSTYFYVVSSVNSGGESTNSSEIGATVPIPPPPAPLIGWFDYEGNSQTGFFTVLHPVGISIFNNDQLIAVNPTTNGISTYYIAGPNPLSGVPGATNGTTPPFYQDGLGFAQPLALTATPDLIIEAVNVGPGGSSPVTTAEFQFVVANPNIIGNNGANFVVSDLTSNVVFYYTTDGSTPTNSVSVATNDLFIATNGLSITTNSFPAAMSGYSTVGTNYQVIVTNGPSFTTNLFPVATTSLVVSMLTNGLTSIGPITNSPATISLNVSTTNVTFTVRAFRNGYQPSGSAIQVFSPAAFVPNTISFGFASGEGSSDFVASPGQTFVAPVTLSPLPSTTIYSMQFNLTVTNLGSAPALPTGSYAFQSFLEKPDPLNPGTFIQIPPLMFSGYAVNPPPPSQIVTYIGTDGNSYPFVNLEATNSSLNLLAVGWLERIDLKTPLLYNTASQTLITYSQAHDVQFLSSSRQVEVGGYSLQVPVTAQPGDAYQIQIGLPSATDDGIGTPGSLVFIYAPTNGSLGGGSLNSIKNVTVGQRKYLVGDSYPFRWFNAGDFGNTNLENADVEQVFQSAIYGLNTPPAGSDFFDAMDSCGGTYVDLGHGYLEFNSMISGAAALNPLFDGNDSSINQIAFGDGTLDVCDVYVTFRRSLDPSLTLFQRFWTNGVRVAQIFQRTNLVSLNSLSKSQALSSPGPVSITNTPAVNFASTDFVASAGQVLQIPITARAFGNYPLRVAMLNISIVPMDGSPAITTPVSFTPNALGTPYITSSQGNGNYAAAWLDSTIAGISNSSATIGTLTVTVPTNATSLSSYAIHFDHASGSPNGIASLPKQVLTGLITLSSRTNSSYADGIPDSWRLRWFGTVNNLLSVSNASPSGDGINNWTKYVAGVDPNTANDFPKLRPESAPPSGYSSAIYWPTVGGKQYAIERSTTLFPGNWTSVTTNTGTGSEMEFDDNSAGAAKFYRVRILP